MRLLDQEREGRGIRYASPDSVIFWVLPAAQVATEDASVMPMWPFIHGKFRPSGNKGSLFWTSMFPPFLGFQGVRNWGGLRRAR